MPKTIRQQRERQKKMIILLVVLLGAMGVSLYFGLGLGEGSGSSAPLPTSTTSQGGVANPIASVSLDLEVLERPEFLMLQVFGDIPIVVGPTGRPNPFLAP